MQGCGGDMTSLIVRIGRSNCARPAVTLRPHSDPAHIGAMWIGIF